LIEDVTPRNERIPRRFDHKNGISGIEQVNVAVGELSPIDRWYSALLGAKGQSITDNELRAEGLSYQVGTHRLNFLTPKDAGSPLVNWMRRFGPSPYSALLKGSAAKVTSLDLALTHGAQLYVN
jgi:hypothetical protein